MTKKLLWLFVVAVIGIGAYFAQTAWQTQQGEDALRSTALDFLPLEQALTRSRTLGKPVLVDFSAIWCPTCRAMHANVFTNTLVKQAIKEGYVLARVDYESPEAPAFMRRYEVQGFPSLLVLAGGGALLRRVPVNFDPAAFAKSLGS
jgi:thiol:disulfide interchange protein